MIYVINGMPMYPGCSKELEMIVSEGVKEIKKQINSMSEDVIDLKLIEDNIIYTIVSCKDQDYANRNGYFKDSRVVATKCSSIVKIRNFRAVTVIDGGSSKPINEVIMGAVMVKRVNK